MPDGLGALAIEASVLVIAMVLLLIWLLTRDSGVSRTSFGFHVERKRDETEVWSVQPLPPPTPPPPLPPRPNDVVEDEKSWPQRRED